MSSLVDTFKDEALELLQELEAALLELEESPDDPSLVDRVFRALHTLKGSGGLAGFENVAGFCHEAETVFEQVRSGEREIDQDLVSLTLSAQDHLKGMILAEFGAEAINDELTAELVAAFQALLPFHPQDATLVDEDHDFRAFLNFKVSIRKFRGLFCRCPNRKCKTDH